MVMARFLVAFDLSLRRVQCQRHRYRNEIVVGHVHVRKLQAEWKSRGFDHLCTRSEDGLVHVHGWERQTYVTALPGTTMPPGRLVPYAVGWDITTFRVRTVDAPDWVGKLKLDPNRYKDATLPPEELRPKLEQFRLFSVAMRQYLQRNILRHFRKLGKTQPERYVGAISEALLHYQDGDVDGPLPLLDNWD